jgi:uncharacterized zinc-type alcohol dehydrogenase-like protein
MLDNGWQITRLPFVPGHRIAGNIKAVGHGVSHLTTGQTVGLGGYAHSCMTCRQCMSGNHNLCSDAVGTIVGRHGGFADKVRAHKGWVIPLPEGVNSATARPDRCFAEELLFSIPSFKTMSGLPTAWGWSETEGWDIWH